MATRIHEFGDFRLDRARRSLERKDGAAVALGAKAFDALVLLIEHAGEPVSRKALIEALWPDTVVEENSLTQAISALRRALGKGSIVTLPGRGYQFVWEVRNSGSPADAAATNTVTRPPDAVEAHARGPRPSAHETPRRSADDGAQPAGGRAAATERVDDELAGARARRPPARGASIGTHGFNPARRTVFAGAAMLAALLGSWVYLSFGTQEVGENADGGDESPTSIAVLPFANLDPEQRYFSDGLTEDLIIALQRLPGLRVTGRTTSLALRDSGRSASEIAAALDMDYVLEGSVDRAGDRLRVRAQLSDASGFSVWPYSYDGRIGDVFDVQDEIVRGIAEELRGPLGVTEVERHPATDDIEAYQLYFAALAESHLSGEENYRRALELLSRALDIDPSFAGAWMQKSLVHSIRRDLLSEGREAERADAETAALQALALAPHRGDGYAALAFVRAADGDWLDAERNYHRALASGFPLSEMPHYAVMHLANGRFADAQATLERSLRTDPLNGVALAFLMQAHELKREHEAADALYQRGRTLHPDWLFGDTVWLWIRLSRREIGPDNPTPVIDDPRFARFAALIDNPGTGLELLRAATKDPAYASPVALTNLAIWAAYFGDATLSLRLLEDGVASGSAFLLHVAWLPLFDDVRRLPEFKVLLNDLGIVHFWQTVGWPDICRLVDDEDFVCE